MGRERECSAGVGFRRDLLNWQRIVGSLFSEFIVSADVNQWELNGRFIVGGICHWEEATQGPSARTSAGSSNFQNRGFAGLPDHRNGPPATSVKVNVAMRSASSTWISSFQGGWLNHQSDLLISPVDAGQQIVPMG
jgi:hypothetical protein